MKKVERVLMSVGIGEYDEITPSVYQPSCRVHRKTLEKSIAETNGNTTLGKVDSDFVIIDGHGRYEACKKLGLPFTFVVVDSDNKTTMQVDNTEGKEWKTIDYVGHNAVDDNDYAELYKYMCSNKVPMEALSRWHGITAKSLQHYDDISHLDINAFTKQINVMKEIKYKTGTNGSREIIRALGKLWEFKEFDVAFLVKSIDAYWLSMYPKAIDGDRTVLIALSKVYDKNTKQGKPKFFEQLELRA